MNVVMMSLRRGVADQRVAGVLVPKVTLYASDGADRLVTFNGMHGNVDQHSRSSAKATSLRSPYRL
jgi:hypothetical protein